MITNILEEFHRNEQENLQVWRFINVLESKYDPNKLWENNIFKASLELLCAPKFW